MAKFLVTGGAGFIGGNFLHIMVNKYPNDEYVCLDALTYAGNMETLEPIMNKPNFKFVHENICNRKAIYELFEKEHFDYVINFAAESHVDRSIENPEIFLETNVIGTSVLMDACRKYGIKRFHQVSTDEVYGATLLNSSYRFKENDLLSPTNPYSVSKASSDLLTLSFYKTYGLNVTISRCSNNFGMYQYEEKLIPLVIKNAMNNHKIPVYGNGNNIRDWINVKDHVYALDEIVQKGKSGEIYNISTHNEHSNIELIKFILKVLNKDESLIEYVKDRKGHDLRYALDTTKLNEELGIKFTNSNFFDELEKYVLKITKAQ